jgi:16S rRNA (adenine1518-N6/adenine1519-N6)-dimethyltransferase
MPNKLLGQHFLKNPAVAQQIISALAPKHGDTIVEIGPGNGELTIPLLKECEARGAKMIAVEKDAKLAEALQKNPALKKLEVIEGDILETIPKLGLKDYKLVGNIPYYLTGHLLRVMSEHAPRPERTVIMMQKEVVERMTASPPRMNRLAASVQFWASPKIVARVPKENFAPMPKVDSTVVLLEELQKNSTTLVNAETYYAALRALFAQPRKTILNNLSAAKPNSTKDTLTDGLATVNVSPKARPQDLSIGDIKAIAAAFWG